MTTENSPDACPHLKDRIVLLIEDDAIMLRTLGRAFQREGCRIVGARDGDEGLTRFLERTPDLVVTDILMPNREGVETIVAMKAKAPDVKILAISGGGRLGAEQVLELASRLGADAVLPTDDDAFLSELEIALEGPRTRELQAFDAITPRVVEVRGVQ